ncbi:MULTISPECIES: type II toxin-antitoxin system RelE/ParE family toxin [Xanthomonas]|uniref:Plasmid stabilization protein ParE n=1 Tax=Xanthomonas arboricola TaxID=56448 RepID=A0A2S7AIW4_9XANT|nr:type II toxin-antitoxin system RelE/ParE family toxin [Xanthomonas arboricola]MBB4767555.1 plasmid stabilization system protein ParE [Xanthomonas arboricola]MBB5674098.1 plasmid stabilization system protein ParE [Xanthomonas arboricola]MCC8669187.1 type II toxin-antitoxin system RelE/ParE family toxin [Xanthomonas arboricola]PPU09808.1 plasmid stabilization protein ParE [Xanthomonas arboricola]SOU04163.1 plasmid stabilization system protein, RelE-ParE family [Xanthomonas arboricola pv. frag
MLRRDWTVPAARQLAHAQDHYHALNPTAAAAMARQVLEATRTLAEQPGRGRAGRVAGTREWVVKQTPYVLVYRVRDDALQLLHVRLETQDWLPRTEPLIERIEPWIAALISALLHVLMLLILLSASTPTMTPPQGSASGGRTKVDFVGDTATPEQPTPSPTPTPPSQTPAPVQPPPAASPVQSTLVKTAKNPIPPAGNTRRGGLVEQRQTQPVQRPTPPQPPAEPSSPPQRRPETWTGRPPGMLEEQADAAEDGMSNTPTISEGRRRDRNNAQPSMDVGGYQVYYEVRSETQLRNWRDQGMKEVAIILPGTQYRMVCPLEVALKRGSSKCRLLPPDSPELKDIGDAREVINMMEVYKQGEPVWRGPGPYR